MHVQSRIDPAPQVHATAGECPEPLSLETLAVIQQALGEVLQGLRQRATAHAAREAGAREYASWLPRLH
jgi:hypothetical protein